MSTARILLAPERFPEQPPRWHVGAMIAIGALFVVLVAVGALVYSSFAAGVRDDARALLLSTARSRSREIAHHVAERRADALVIASDREAQRLAAGGNSAAVDARLRRELMPKMRLTAGAYGYRNIVIFDTASRPVIALQPDDLSAETIATLAAAMRERRSQVVPLHLAIDGSPEYGAIAPVFASDSAGAPVVGAVLLALPAREWLYPSLFSSGVLDVRFEITLAQLQGDTMVIAQTTKLAADVPPLSLRFPMTPGDSAPAIMRVLRRPSLVYERGPDYLGVNVDVGASSIAGTPWAVTLKVPVAEAEAALRLLLGALVVIAVLLVGALYGFVVVLQRRARRVSERAARISADRALRMVQASMDGVVVLDGDGRFIEVNDVVAEMTGYSAAEFGAMRLEDVKVSDGGESEAAATISRIKSGATRRYLSQWRRKDGRIIDVDVSASFLRTERSEQIYAFIRDVTETLRRRRSLERLNQLYQFVNHASEGSVVARSAEEAYERICQAAVDDAGFRIAWVGKVEPSEHVVHPVRCHGAPQRALDRVVVTLDPGLPTSQGAAVRAVLQRRVCVGTDLENDAATAVLRRLMPELALRWEVACPIVIDGEVSAVIVLYTEDPDPLEPEAITLIGEVARLVSLIVQSLASAERVARSEARFRQLFDRSPLPHYVIEERSGRITRVNRALTALFGYELADLPDVTTVMERFYPDPTYRAMLGESEARQLRDLKSDTPVIRTADISIRCKNGHEVYAQAFVTRTDDELIVSWVDLTELRSNQLLLSEAQQMASIGSWDIDQRSGAVHFSPELHRILELEPDAHPATDLYFRRVVPVELGLLQQVFARLRNEQEPIVLEHRLQFPDGRTKTVVLRALTHFDTEGAPLRSIGSVQDVTAQAETRRDLERYRDHLEDLVAARTGALAKANATLQTTDKRLKAMLAMSQRASALDEREIYQLGMDEAVRLTSSDSGYIHRISDDQTRIEFALWSSGIDEHCRTALESRFPADQAGVLVDLLLQRTSLVQNDVAPAPIHLGAPVGQSVLQRHMSVPVIEGEKVRLLIGVGNKPDEYDHFDVQELQLIGHDIWTIVSRRRAELALERAFEAVRASEERFAFAMDASSAGIWDWDFKTDRIDASAVCYTMLGFRPGEFELTGERFRELLHPDDRIRIERDASAQLAALGGFALEYRLRARDGSWRWMLSHAKVTARNARGIPTRAVGTHTDLTARRTAEDELRTAKEQADAANRAKSAFLAVMSHEIRTPLNGVLGMAEVLAESSLPAKDADAVRTIRTSASNLLSLVDDILDFSKIEAGRLDLEYADTSIPDILEDVCAGLTPAATRRQVELSFFLSPSIPQLVRSDAVRLRQILYNLVGNAVKFSGGRSDRVGRVTIRVTRADTDALALRFTVQDNGIGMASETIDRLFGSFMQAEASTTRRFGGTGLGLAICKRLTDLFGGSIGVVSELGRGSTFTLTVPVEPSDEQPDRHLSDVRGIHCVVVRDPLDPQDIDDLAEQLAHAGAVLTFAATPDEAIAAAGRLPRLVVIIERLPDGTDVAGPVAVEDKIPHVRITHGQRRTARILGPNSVTIDRQNLREQSFLRAVAIAAGRAAPEVLHDPVETPLVEADARPHSIAEARALGRLILVAEDDEINQKVTLRQLKLLGYTGEIATNGRDALAMWRRGGYAMLLTDLHMPEMDGYALTQAIRNEERGGDRFPIVALTANALRGEATHARAAGMDDYLTKPVPLRALKRALKQWVGSRDGAAIVEPLFADPLRDTTRPPAPPALDRSALAALVGNDPAVIDSFLREFDESARRLADAMRAAYALNQLGEVGNIAHRLKSSARTVGAARLGDRCADLEAAVQHANAGDVRAALDAFTAEQERVQQDLARLFHPA